MHTTLTNKNRILLDTENLHHLINRLKQNELLLEIIKKSSELNIPNWHVGAGIIANTVWNNITKKPILDGVKDIDWVYFDSSDLSVDHENRTIEKVRRYFDNIPLKLDVKNQARVHLWYEEKFGYKINAYKSIYQAIDTWPTTSTTIAFHYDKNLGFQCYSTYGFHDVLNMTVRANKTQITKEIYLKKVARWKEQWPELKIISWEE